MNDPETVGVGSGEGAGGAPPGGELVPTVRRSVSLGGRILTALGATLGLVLALAGLAFLSSQIPLGGPLILMLLIAQGWALYVALHYRQERREELVFVLAAAAEARAPLGPALDAYAAERPETGWRRAWSYLLLLFPFPGYWFWHRLDGFDRRVARVARLLREGLPLHEALRDVPGVVPRTVVLGAAVGEATGRLAECLRRSVRGQTGVVWMEALPRMLYPVGLLFFLLGVTRFWAVFILPRMERIFHDFGSSVPQLTRQVADFSRFASGDDWGAPLLFGVLTALGFLVVFVPTVRYNTPVVGRLYQMSVQGRVMTLLGVLLEAGRTVPEALTLLAAEEEPGALVWRRLRQARAAVEQGDTLAESLGRAGLLPRSAVGLVQSAERARNLPWALAELGDALAARTARLSERVSLTLFPLAVCAIGVLVGFLVLGMFFPLLKIMSELAS